MAMIAAARMKTSGLRHGLHTEAAKVKDSSSFITKMSDFPFFHPSILRLLEAVGAWNGVVAFVPYAFKSVKPYFQKPPFKYNPKITNTSMKYQLGIVRYTSSQLSVEITPKRKLLIVGEIDGNKKTLYNIKLPPGEYETADVEAKLDRNMLNVRFKNYKTSEEYIPIVLDQPKPDSQTQSGGGLWKKGSRYKGISDCLQHRYGIGGLFYFQRGYTTKAIRSFPNQMLGRRSFSSLPSTTESAAKIIEGATSQPNTMVDMFILNQTFMKPLLLCIGSVLLIQGSKYVKAKWLCKRPQPLVHMPNGFGNKMSCVFDLKGCDVEKVSCEILDQRKLIVYCPDRSTNVRKPVYIVDLPTGSYINATITAKADIKQRLLTVMIQDYKPPSLKIQVPSS